MISETFGSKPADPPIIPKPFYSQFLDPGNRGSARNNTWKDRNQFAQNPPYSLTNFLGPGGTRDIVQAVDFQTMNRLQNSQDAFNCTVRLRMKPTGSPGARPVIQRYSMKASVMWGGYTRQFNPEYWNGNPGTPKPITAYVEGTLIDWPIAERYKNLACERGIGFNMLMGNTPYGLLDYIGAGFTIFLYDDFSNADSLVAQPKVGVYCKSRGGSGDTYSGTGAIYPLAWPVNPLTTPADIELVAIEATGTARAIAQVWVNGVKLWERSFDPANGLPDQYTTSAGVATVENPGFQFTVGTNKAVIGIIPPANSRYTYTDCYFLYEALDFQMREYA